MKRIVLGFFTLIAPASYAMEPQGTQAPANVDDVAMPCPAPNTCFACGHESALSTTGYHECHTHLCDYCLDDTQGHIEYNPEEKRYFLKY